MKKVLIAMMSLHSGGAERSLVNFLQELPPEKYQLDLMLFKREGAFLSQVPDWVHQIDPPEGLRLLYSPLPKAGRLAVYKLAADMISRTRTKGFREKRAYRWEHYYTAKVDPLPGQYDAAVAYMSEDVMAFIDQKVNARRKIVFVHSDYRSNHFPKAFDEPHFANMDAIVSISQTCVDILREEFPQFREKICLLENITSSAAIRKRAEAFSPREIDKTCTNILSIGRLVKLKNFSMAIDAAALLKRRQLRFHWIIIGSGELRKNLEKQIRQLGLEKEMQLLGAQENPYPYIAHSDMLVQCSLFEGKSIVLDEAKILGVPIVATEYPTVRDQVTENKEGLIVPITPEGLADGIEKMARDTVLREGIVRCLGEKDYGNTSELQKYLELIDG